MEPTTIDVVETAPPKRRRGRGEKFTQSLTSVGLGILGLVVAVLAWEALVRIKNYSAFVLPTPEDVWHALWRLSTVDPTGKTSLFYQAVPTLEAALLGFVGATLVGFALGFVLFEFKLVSKAAWPLVVAFQALPKVAIAPVLVIWLGPEMDSKVVLVLIVSFFPVFINTMAGFEALDPDLEEMLRSFGAKRRHMFRFGRFPAALPTIFAGIEAALLLSLVAVVVAEFVAAQRGLGFMITQAQYNLDMPAVFAVLVVFCVVGIVLLELLTWAERKIVFWKTSRRGIFAYVEGAQMRDERL